MDRRKGRAFLLTAALLLSASLCAVGASTPVYGEDAAEVGTGDVKAVPVLVVEGNTIYVDAISDGPWNVIQATVAFDPSNEVEEYGVTDGFVLAANEQGVIGIPAQNVTDDGKFIFTAAYTSGDGTGVEYDGHLFYITFKDTSAPIEFTMYDEFDYELLSAAVDGAEEAVTYVPSDEVLAVNEAQHEADLAAAEEASQVEAQNDTDENADEGTDSDAAEEKEGSFRSALLVIVVIAVVALAAVAVVFSRKNGQAEDAAPGGSDVADNKEIKSADRPGEQKTETETEESSGQDKD